jgi:hypothetical protein
MERLVMRRNSLISLVPSRNVLQHETGTQNEADTARNPYFAGLNGGAG